MATETGHRQQPAPRPGLECSIMPVSLRAAFATEMGVGMNRKWWRASLLGLGLLAAVILAIPDASSQPKAA